jgi:hypothetical protein
MTKTEVMKELRANGTAQNRKVLRQHGIRGEMFGVSYAALGKLRKKIKTDQALAEQLWATGNLDARVLTTMIADPGKISVATLNAWGCSSIEPRGRSAICKGSMVVRSLLLFQPQFRPMQRDTDIQPGRPRRQHATASLSVRGHRQAACFSRCRVKRPAASSSQSRA